MQTAETAKLSADTRFFYITSADVKLTCSYTSFSNTWAFTIDKVFRKLRTQVPGTAFTLNKKRMQQLVAILKGVN